jgi:hypothetical protein
MRHLLRGVDRSVLTVGKNLLSSAPVQAVATTPRRS